jgi:hypothetical protein
LVQKEKEVTQLRETIDRMEKKYKDKAELVTVSASASCFLGAGYWFTKEVIIADTRISPIAT